MNCEICEATPVETVSVCGIETKLCKPHAIAWRAKGKAIELLALVMAKGRIIERRLFDAEEEARRGAPTPRSSRP